MASIVPLTPRGDPAVGMLQGVPCYLCPVNLELRHVWWQTVCVM